MRKVIRYAFFWGLNGLAQGAAVAAIIFPQPREAALLVAALYVLTALGMVNAIGRAAPSDPLFHPNRRLGYTLAALTFAVPVAGWLSTALIAVASVFGGPRHRFPGPGDELIPAPELPAAGPARSRTERLRRELDIVPLSDIMAGNDVALKLAAVERLGSLATTEAIALLFSHRAASDPDVRQAVIATLARVRRRWEEEVAAARDNALTRPGDHDALFALAILYLRSARSGLYEEALAAERRAEAGRHLMTLVATPLAPQSAGEMLNVLAESGRHDEALALVARMERDGVFDPSEVRRRRTELLYGAGRYAALRAELQSPVSVSGDDPLFRAAADFWRAV